MSSPSDLTLTKLEVARVQLERALALYLRESDFVSAITLAGASEEILGKLLEQCGKKHALSALIEASVEYARVVQDRKAKPEVFAKLANEVRNGLKHITDGQPVLISQKAATEILDRAIENYFALTGNLTSSMDQFFRSAHVR